MHNTQWVTGHFHLIFGGTTAIMYMAIAYHLWPKITGRELLSKGMAVTQLWLWTIGMLVTTLPWHVLGLLGQPRRISSAPYDSPLVEAWNPHEVAMIVGGAILVFSALLLILNLLLTPIHRVRETNTEVEWAEPIHAPMNLPKLLNGYAFWNWVLLVWMIVGYGYPVLQFFVMDTYGSLPWSY